ncbi:MAG: hypothetical protein R6U68_13175 [Desulfobacteraceae bacterium]
MKTRGIQIGVGFFALCTGALIYLVGRPPESTYFVDQFFYKFTLYGIIPNIFGSAHNNLASFLHVFSFVMISAGISADSKTGYLMTALGWAAVNTAFEVGQYFDTAAAAMVPAWFENYPLLEAVDKYFTAGCFDIFDIAAVFAGAAAGFFVLVGIDLYLVRSGVSSNYLKKKGF